VENSKNGLKLEKDFTLRDETLELLEEKGYTREDVQDEVLKFIGYYTDGNGSKQVSNDWDWRFLTFWIDNVYKRGHILRNGKFYGNKAGKETRLESAERFYGEDMFAEYKGIYTKL
jgi:hypothetical protein